jgi:hypothetical protein
MSYTFSMGKGMIQAETEIGLVCLMDCSRMISSLALPGGQGRYAVPHQSAL